MTLRGSFSWMLFLLLAAVVVAGGYGFWVYSNGNELLRQRVLAELKEQAPHWDVSIDRVRFDWGRSLHLYGVTIRTEGDTDDVLQAPEIVVSVDGEALEREQRVDVRRVQLLRPRMTLIREVSGGWNWQRLLKLESKYRASFPEWAISDGSVTVRLLDGRSRPVELSGEDLDLSLTPSGKRRFRIEGRVDVDRVGVVDVTGDLDADRQRWSFDGKARDVEANESLVAIAASASPEFGRKLARFDQRVYALLPHEAGDVEPEVRVAEADVRDVVRVPPIRAAAATRPVPPRAIGHDFSIGGRIDADFRVERNGRDAPIGFTANVDVRRGRLDHPAFPFPLRDVDGRVSWNGTRLEMEDVVAHHGVTRFELDGHVEHRDGRTPARFAMRMRDVVLDEHLTSRLPPRLRVVFETLQPTGRADVVAVIEHDGVTGFVPSDLHVTVRDGTVTYRDFPYRIDDVSGTVEQVDGELVVSFKGRAGRTPVTVEGAVRDPGPRAHSRFVVEGRGIPIDEAFVQACKPEVRETVRRMHLEGNVDFRLDLERPSGPDKPWRSRLVASAKDAAVQFEGFPYRVTDLAGSLTMSSSDRVWRFRELTGKHDTAKLSGSGDFVMGRGDDPGKLAMRIVARNASFDKQLELALPKSIRDVWRSLKPRGRIDAAVDVVWRPGGAVNVALPLVIVSDGFAKPDQFPYDLEDVHLKCSYAEGVVAIASLRATHGDTKVRSAGSVAVAESGNWKLTFEDLFVDDLDPDDEFRRALPESVRTVVDGLDPSGPLSFSGLLRFSGSGDPEIPLRVAWNFETVLTGTSIVAGCPLEKVNGKVKTIGSFDGTTVTSVGEVDLESVVVKGYQFTKVKGPFATNGQQVTIGSRKAFLSPPPPLTSEERITAKAIDGTWVLDGLVVAGETPSYRLKILLQDGRLETYARRYLPGVRNLAGVANGWVELWGRGSATKNVNGRGRLQISPAALYELPVFVQMFKVLSFAPPNRTAFDYALMEFTIGGDRFRFDGIDLVGDAISFRGRGTVGFDGRMNLDFYSRMSRRQLPIPLIGDLVGEAAKGMVAIYVRGNIARPQRPQVVTAPPIDAALRTFLGGFAPRSGPRLP